MPPESLPEEFDDYRILQSLGRGRGGEVFLAFDTVLARHVALKLLLQADSSDESKRRLLLEARTAARVQHPNVVTIHRVGELDGRAYIVAEFVRGETLQQLAKPVPWRRALEIAIPLARGLAAAHRRGVIHRDLKPGNVMLADDGGVKLVDFGLAAMIQGPPHREQADGGLALGTPDYMAPEIWRGEPATRASDVYALGAILHELATGKPPMHGVPLPDLPRAIQEREVPALASAAPEVDPRFAAIVDRCLRREPRDRFRSGDELREALEELDRTASGAPPPVGNPYRGLRPFEADHRAIFFGRGAEVGVLVDRLREEPLVLVTGDSGAGKSSVCRAGVLPAVADGALGGGRTWSAVTIVPGRHPVRALAAAFADGLGLAEEELAVAIRFGGGAFLQRVKHGLGETKGIVLFVDQLEELLTSSESEEAAAVEELLANMTVGLRGFRVLATFRADFLTKLARSPALGEDLTRFLYFLKPLTPERIREVIVGPARATGVTFESEALVDGLVEATAHADGGLPLLQFALAELWEARDRTLALITHAALDSIGGVSGALARHADDVLAGLVPARRAAARRILLRAVTRDGTRARRTEEELIDSDPEASSTLEALVRGRLLVAHEVPDGSVYEIAHEVLLSGWTTLKGWIRDDADGRLVRERVGAAASEWARLGRTADALWSARQLEELVKIHGGELTEAERAFVAASRFQVARQRWLTRALYGGVVALLAVAYLSFSLVTQARIARRVDAMRKEAGDVLSLARQEALRADDLRAKARSLFEEGRLGAAEPIWATALSAGADAERIYARATLAFEAALALDSGRADVRDLLGDALAERALFAERERRFDREAELTDRLALYDLSGDRRRRYAQPGRISVETDPPGARITLERYEEGPDGARTPLPYRDALVSPVPSLELPPASYLLTMTAAGRAPVRLPFLLERGDSRTIQVPLPPASSVPNGYVHVPAGRFLFGSGGDDESRRVFFQTVPIATRRTGPFLIARSEVTFGDWIDFLDALPAAERARHVPGVFTRLEETHGLTLDRTAAGRWRLTVLQEKKSIQATLGEKIRYTSRPHRSLQDWRKMPVTAISAVDADAYVRWLDRTGRLPGARLCNELEWERAARGADDREFPHGRRLQADDANFDETYGKNPRSMGPDEVGSRPRSESPFGLFDMSGNAWEWTTSAFAAGTYVLRGGSFFHDRKTAQVINRSESVATLRHPTVGLRVCADPAGRPAAGALRPR